MKKRLLPLLLALLMLPSLTLAECYEGKTVALTSEAVLSECEGQLTSLSIKAGDVVNEGDSLASLKPTCVYAAVDGTVASLSYKEGDTADGTVLEIMPQSTYLIYCSSSKAYSDPENDHLLTGETLYVKCTKDGTHRAVGRVIQLSGDTYQLETTGGRLYVGETVYLYRSEGLESSSRVGIGTVINAETEAYSAEGVLLSLKVAEGETVEKGQLLYTYLPEGNGSITAPCDGIVTEVSAKCGDQVQKGQELAKIVRTQDIGIEITVSEEDIADVHVGDCVTFTLRSDRQETVQTASVVKITGLAEGEGYTVWLKPEVSLDRLGLSAEVMTQVN